MADQVSWLMITKGWDVVASDGSEIGKVHEIVGDSGDDIFDGLTVTSHLFSHERYVPAERVQEITEGRVQLDLGPAQAEKLEPYKEPAPSEEILSESSSRWQRLAGWFRR